MVKKLVLWYGLKISRETAEAWRGKKMIFVFRVARILTTWKSTRKAVSYCLKHVFKWIFSMHRRREYKVLWLLVKWNIAVCAEWDKGMRMEWENPPGTSEVSRAEGRDAGLGGRWWILSSTCWAGVWRDNFSSRRQRHSACRLDLQRKVVSGVDAGIGEPSTLKRKFLNWRRGLIGAKYPRKNSLILSFLRGKIYWKYDFFLHGLIGKQYIVFSLWCDFSFVLQTFLGKNTKEKISKMSISMHKMI